MIVTHQLFAMYLLTLIKAFWLSSIFIDNTQKCMINYMTENDLILNSNS